MSISDTEGIDLAESVVRSFERGWQHPHPHAWDDLLAPDVVLEQPLLQNGTGIEIWQRGLAQVLELLPDLTGRVVRWASTDDALFLEVELTATLGGRPYSYTAVDRLHFDADGMVVRRTSFLDPAPLALTIAKRPRSWAAWWRSGLPPLSLRKSLAPTTGARERVVTSLGAARVIVGVSTLIGPGLARRALGVSDGRDGTLARLFGVRDGALGLATLSGDRAVREAGLRFGALSDVSDVAAVLLGRRNGVSSRGAQLVAGAAAFFAATGMIAIAATPSPPAPKSHS